MSPTGFVEEEAVVVAREGRYAWVEAARQSHCGQCAVAKGCGTAALGKALGRRVNRVRALNPIGARPGERVVVGVRGEALVKGSLWLYGVPLLAMLGLPLIARTLFGELSEGAAVVFAFVGLVGAFVWLGGKRGRLGQDPALQAVILRHCRSSVTPTPVTVHKNKIGAHHG